MKKLGSLFYAPYGQLSQSYYYVFTKGIKYYYIEKTGFAANAYDERERIEKEDILNYIKDYILDEGYDNYLENPKPNHTDGVSASLREWFLKETGEKSFTDYIKKYGA